MIRRRSAMPRSQKPFLVSTKTIRRPHVCAHVDANDPVEVAKHFLEDLFEKTQIGREPAYQYGFALKVLHEYTNKLDFEGILFDDAKYYLSGSRLP
jgi:hypothetical protein